MLGDDGVFEGRVHCSKSEGSEGGVRVVWHFRRSQNSCRGDGRKERGSDLGVCRALEEDVECGG